MTELRADGTPQVIADAMTAVVDTSRPLEDRAALFGVLQQIRLRVDRALKAARDDIIIGMERGGLKELGPLSIKSTAVDPSYPCNAPENFGDAGIQEAMGQLAEDPRYREFVAKVPEHYEIRVKVLTDALQLGSRDARTLFGELNRRGWRKEEARRLSLAVREVKRPKEAA